MAIDPSSAATFASMGTSLIPEDEEETDKTKKAATGALKGAGSGAATGAMIGTKVFPGIGTLVGALGGMVLGGVAGGVKGSQEAQAAKDKKKVQASQQLQAKMAAKPPPEDIMGAAKAKAQQRVVKGLIADKEPDELDDQQVKTVTA